MVVKFGKDYLRELFEEGKSSDKHHRYQPAVIKKYVLRVATLQSAPNIETLYPLNSLGSMTNSATWNFAGDPMNTVWFFIRAGHEMVKLMLI